MLHWLWPLGSVARDQPIATIKPPRRKRSNEPHAFAGLTNQSRSVPCVSKKPRFPIHCRPRTVDTSRHFCPVVCNNRIAASQVTQLVDDQLGVQGKALLDNHVPSSDNSQE